MAKIVVEIFHTGQVPQEYRMFDAQEIHIGRGYQNDCIITDPFVSEEHCVLWWQEGQWILEDTHSDNGVYSRRLQKEVEKVGIEPGDEFVIGRTRLRFVDPEQAVEATKLLILRSKSHRRLSRAVNAWSLICLTLLLYAVNMYLESFERLSLNKLMAISLWQMVSVLIWASIWSFVGRLIKHRTQFWGQVSVTCLFWIMLLPVSYGIDTAGYLLNSFIIHWSIFAVLMSALFAMLLTRNLSIATNLSRVKQMMISGTISLLIISIGTISYVAFKDEFNPRPNYYAQLQPPFFKVRPSQPISSFIAESAEVFETPKGL